MEMIKLTVFIVILIALLICVAKKFKRGTASALSVVLIIALYWLFYYSGIIP